MRAFLPWSSLAPDSICLATCSSLIWNRVWNSVRTAWDTTSSPGRRRPRTTKPPRIAAAMSRAPTSTSMDSYLPDPVTRATLRMVGPPLPMRLACMGWPLPQLGMGKSWKSLPTASTRMKKSRLSDITPPSR